MSLFPRHSLGGLTVALTLVQSLTNASPLAPGILPRYFQNAPVTRRQVPVAEMQDELGALLSPESTMLFPSDDGFLNTTQRWNTLAPPEIEVVVQPVEESDIAKIVKFCNRNSLEFLAVNTGHGFTTTLGRFKGVQIDLKQLRAMSVNIEEETATMQGGAYNHDIFATLWEKGYVSSTGASECVGLVGAAIGGGHGRVEGMHGLASDNLLHLDMVLADGSTVGVNSTSHADLYWAMRGAGHNFGIVTSVTVRIFPRQVDTWHWHNYFWSHDKLETVFEELNRIADGGRTPPRLAVNYGQISMNQTLDAEQAVLWWTFAYAGPADEAEEVLAPFNAIDALDSEMGDASYPDLVGPQRTAFSACGGGDRVISTMMTQTWNVTTERELYNLLMRNIALYPELAPSAVLFYEGYSVEAVKAVEPASTAYPHRDEYHLSFMMSELPEGSPPELRATAEQWARDSWDLWVAGQPTRKPATYLNYAVGTDYQTLESIYGYEPWRLQKLRALKRKYDPSNRFRFYQPIVAS